VGLAAITTLIFCLSFIPSGSFISKIKIKQLWRDTNGISKNAASIFHHVSEVAKP